MFEGKVLPVSQNFNVVYKNTERQHKIADFFVKLKNTLQLMRYIHIADKEYKNGDLITKLEK